MENMECPKCWDGTVMLKENKSYREEARELESRAYITVGIWDEWQKCQRCGYQRVLLQRGRSCR